MITRNRISRRLPEGVATPSFPVRFARAMIGGLVLVGAILATTAAQGQDKLPLPKDEPPRLPQPKAGGDGPKVSNPFGQGKIRLPGLGDDPKALGFEPKPNADDLREAGEYVEGVVDPRYTLDLVVGRTRLLLLKESPTQTQIAEPATAELSIVNPKQITLQGKAIGTTVLTVWFKDKINPNKEKILSYLIRVIPDPEERRRIEKAYEALEIELSKAFPDSRIRLNFVGDKLIMRGQAKDVFEMTQILRIVRANAPGGGNQGGNQGSQQQPGKVPVGTVGVDGRAAGADPTNPFGTPGQESFVTASGLQVVNLMRVTHEQQVLLRVTVAEVNRTAARSVGINFSLTNNSGIRYFAQLTGGLPLPGGNLPILLDNGQVPIALNALKQLSYARSLAEPNMVAINGQQATFLAGGQFPVPQLAGIGAGGIGGALQGVSFIPFGVQLSFSPVITDRDRIRLNVTATVSTRDAGAGANIGGAAVPGLSARSFSTTVEMREGQTMAVGGLIQNSIGANSARVPFFGDIPYLGRLFRVDDTSAGEQELVILVTPELVHPLEKKEIPKLPGADLFEPSDAAFFLKGSLEGLRSYDYRSPVMNDIHRMIQWRKMGPSYIFGPIGHTDDPNYPIP